jgi:hypothetical protein
VHGVHAGLQCHHAGGTHADTHKHTFFLRNQLLSVAIVPHAHRSVSGSEALCCADLSVEAHTDDALTSPCAHRSAHAHPSALCLAKSAIDWQPPTHPPHPSVMEWTRVFEFDAQARSECKAALVASAMRNAACEQGGAALQLPRPARHPESRTPDHGQDSQSKTPAVASRLRVNLPRKVASTAEGGHTHPQQPASSAKATFQKP